MTWTHARVKGLQAASAEHFLKAERMRTGPFISDNIIIIPSDYYNPAAVAFWKSIGAAWRPTHPTGQCWVLNPAVTTYNGRHWSADQWLTAIRRRYFNDFWPGIDDPPVYYCVACGQEFEPWHPDQQFCKDCTST